MFRRVNGKWIIAAVMVLMLRAGVGPALLGVQLVTGAFAPGGNCGNSALTLPNTDPISWWLSDGTATAFEDACSDHDRCYNTLGQRKGVCDRAFIQDMRSGCRETYSALDAPGWLTYAGHLGCRLQAETYFIGVWAALPIQLTYCYEQYYARTGSRDDIPDPITAIKECGRR
jgi:hypothetical protein